MAALFHAGEEKNSGSEYHRTYLILSGTGDYRHRAFIGGAMILMLPAVLLAAGGKGLGKLIEKNHDWKTRMKKQKDIHSIINSLLGTMIALITGIYYIQIPGPMIAAMIFASTLLVTRELWLMGGKLRWTTTSK